MKARIVKLNTLQKWVVIGVSELLLSLVLLWNLPNWLNSDQYMFGFFILLLLSIILGCSVIYVVLNILDARKARQIFINKFSEYSYLTVTDFLGLSSVYVARKIPTLEACKEDPEFDSLNISLFEVLKHRKKL